MAVNKVSIDENFRNADINIKNAANAVVNPATSDNQTNGLQQVQGNKASGVADSGNPVKVGGVFNNSPITLTNGQRGDLQIDNSGLLRSHTYFDVGYTDAFNRLRVSNPNTIFDIQNQYNTSPLYFYTQLTGSGTVAHLSNQSSVSLNVGTTTGDKAIWQTKEYSRYQPGKSQLILMSAIFGTRTANVRKRVGYHDTNDGLFFEDDGTTFYVVVRSSTSGSPVETRVAQANFNGDTLDGNGPSKMNLDLTKANLFWIDFEWLGVGIVNFGIYSTTLGIPIVAHTFQFPNTLTVPYMKTANLPQRSSIENTGTSATPSSLIRICSAVITEDGGTPQAGMNATASNATIPTAVTTRRAVLSIRPKGTFNGITNRGQIKDIEYELIASTGNSFYELVYNPTLGSAPIWTSAGPNSITEYSLHNDGSAGTLTGGSVLASGFVVAGLGQVGGQINRSILSKLPLCLDISGTNPTPMSLVCTSFSGTSNVSASFDWKELY